MAAVIPLELRRLLRASPDDSPEAAWEELIGHHTRLLLAVSGSFGGDRDAAMDRYSFILEKLREGNFRRLRTFDSEAGATFSTWLTVTARRLCLDHHRAKYGRPRVSGSTGEANSSRTLRRALVDAIGSELDLDNLADVSSVSPDARAEKAERDNVLRRELAKLTPRERLLLALRFEDDKSAAQIASFAGLPSPFHVYRQLGSILARLRAALESRGIDSVDG